MLTSDWSMEPLHLMVELKSVTTRHGEPFVIKAGAHLMPTSPADNLDLLPVVRMQRIIENLINHISNHITGTPRYNAFYGQGSGPLLLDDLICRGTESRLIDCPSGGIGMTDFCRGHLDDAGLECRESMLLY